MLQNVNELRAAIKHNKPLVLNITNHVTMDFVANGLLSLGASPIMSLAPQEMEDLIKLCDSVVINLGTLSTDFIFLCEQACKLANRLDKPVILDPVGAGASSFRTEAAQKLISNYHIAILRGNASEIMSLSGIESVTRGVDSSFTSLPSLEGAKKLARRHNMLIVISGATDFILDEECVIESSYGSPLMPKITGSGCLLTAVVGAFQAVIKDRFEAAHAATVFYGMCGESAALKSLGTGFFKPHLLDALQGASYEN